MMRLAFSFVSIICLMCAPALAETIFYLNFDQNVGGPYADGTPYTPGSTEVVRADLAGLGNVTFAFRNNAGDGPAIGAAAVASGTCQGGNALLVDSCSGQDEGLQITAENGLACQDFTMEVLWYTVDAACSGNNFGIQSMCGDEWPFGEISMFFMRTGGADRFDYWNDREAHGENVQILGTGVNQALTWYHDVIVYDHNDATPASSSMEAFRNGVSQGTTVFNAISATVSLFGTAYNGNRTFAIGFHNRLDWGYTDHRGLSGGVDAFALSTGKLGPGTFVLPEGVDLAGVDAGWDLYR